MNIRLTDRSLLGVFVLVTFGAAGLAACGSSSTEQSPEAGGAAGAAGGTAGAAGGSGGTAGATGGTGGATGGTGGATGGTGGATGGTGGATGGTGGATGGTGGATGGTGGATGGTGGATGGTGGATGGSGGATGGTGGATGGTGGAAAVGHGLYGYSAIASFDNLPASDKNTVKNTKVFFAHQSVGQYMLEGSQRVGFPFQTVENSSFYNTKSLGDLLFLDDGIDNGDAAAKINGFVKWVNNKGIGNKVDVVSMKFCYSDIEDGTNLSSVESKYESAVSSIRAAHPSVHIIHVTPPIETADDWNVKMNKLRLQVGSWMINKYKDTDVVFDLADIESRKSDGTQCTMNGTAVLCGANNWSQDDQHPNPATQDRLAKAFLFSIYQTTK